ncbi:MAG: NTP transferase domain-containing protein [Deltaproteobacteria bacterium]|jgi:CTP:molybdopterin cytidylyltransferase MocA|nr:NTP transferase domain-containing protein [Deltaproteobacteria bacterium]
MINVFKPLKVRPVILAAGLSSRFQPAHKALRPPWGAGLLRQAISTLNLIGFARPLTVVGYRAAEVGAEALSLGSEVILNPLYERGMFSSVVKGLLKAKEEAVEAAAVLPVDAGLVSPSSLLALLAFWFNLEPEPSHLAAIAFYNGLIGHPPVIGSSLFDSIVNYQRSFGLRGALASLSGGNEARKLFIEAQWPRLYQSGALRFMDSADPSVLGDIDEPKDLEEALKVLSEFKGPERPTIDQALTWLAIGGKENKKAHMLTVSVLSLRLSLALGAQDAELAFLGGLVHDIVRDGSWHDLKSRERAEAMGWRDLGLVIGAHSEFPVALGSAIDFTAQEGDRPRPDGQDYYNLPSSIVEATLCVHLADKYAKGAEIVDLERRFKAALEKPEPLFRNGAQRRYRVAKALEKWFGQRIGAEPLEVILSPSGHRLEQEAFKAASGEAILGFGGEKR